MVKKLIRTILVLLLVSVAVSSMLDFVPGDPAYAILGESATPESLKQVHDQLGLDRPFLERYADWGGGIVSGDFGESYFTRQPVLKSIKASLPVTAELVFLTLLFAIVISIPLAVLAARRPGKLLDRVVSTMLSITQAMPAFVAVPVAVYVLALKLDIFPATGWSKLGDGIGRNLEHVILPCFIMSLSVIPIFVAALRSDMIGTLQQDFILNARAKGLSERVILLRHALRPSSLSLFTFIGLALGQLISGAVIVEILFALPGLGSLTRNAIVSRDVPIVQGVVMFLAIWYVLLNVLVDIGYRILDPRVRVGTE